MQFLLKYIIPALILVNCAALPPAPKTRICLINARTNSLRCINYKQTKYNVPVSKADKYVCTPGKDYLELNAYLNKMADIFRKEVLNKVGR
jgi:hypothetical protein